MSREIGYEEQFRDAISQTCQEGVREGVCATLINWGIFEIERDNEGHVIRIERVAIPNPDEAVSAFQESERREGTRELLQCSVDTAGLRLESEAKAVRRIEDPVGMFHSWCVNCSSYLTVHQREDHEAMGHKLI